MKTLLVGVNPYGIVGMAPYYLKSYCKGKVDREDRHEIRIEGYDVELDARRIAASICDAAPDVVGFSCYVWNMEKVLEVCPEIRRRSPGTRIVFGGPEVSPRAQDLLRQNAEVDVIAIGEGEMTFSDLLESYAGGNPLEDVDGIAFRRGGEIKTTKPRALIKNLDDIPSPFLEGYVDCDKLGGYLYGYETFRGCPYSCSFCYWGRMFDVRYFSMERIKKELAVILNSSLRRMWLGDAVANLHKKRFKEFLRAVIEQNTETVIDFEMVADILDEETIDLLGQLNDGYIAFGLQSINDRALATIERNWDPVKFGRNVRLLRQRTDKIKIYIDLIYGLPEDTLETYEAGIRYAMSLLPQKIQPHPLLLLPGSPLHTNPEAYGIVYEERAPHYVRQCKTWSPEDMDRASRWTNKLFFYFNPAVNTATILLSQILEEEPLDLFLRLYDSVTRSLDPTLVFTDIGIARENAFRLNDLLADFIRRELSTVESGEAYLAPLLDVVAFAGCRTMFYFSGGGNGTGASVPWALFGGRASGRGIYPVLNRNVVIRRFSHDMSGLYKGNLLRSPRELLRLEPKTYDVVFNLQTHAIYHVSAHVSEILASCSGDRTLEEVVEGFARARSLALDEGSYSVIQATFEDLARRQVVNLIGDRIAI
jgi:radical SAM superfamily enzyme YgiQ (UPF0313 family)